ncbi:hypothetical protein Alg130_11248 [Pyrenophora tritici-repentis]|nr:hypothetical protein PtrV1_12948 [Pyrenophora tritici-repentis]KAI0569026.1 hypothetical protein Alg215_11876 [Pyrenophora tritici-repentis]KAI0570406.1 hypothetical protein Alg130_11248 [Pyrenophora tritici-repentis]KAI0604559.1 hypothetical protein TUN205_11198 [Pyrenophora tritici-repentis]
MRSAALISVTRAGALASVTRTGALIAASEQRSDQTSYI